MDSLTELMLPPDELQMGEEQEKLLAGYNDAMKRLGKAVAEIKALRGTVKTSQNSADEMELVNIRLQQSLASLEVQQAAPVGNGLHVVLVCVAGREERVGLCQEVVHPAPALGCALNFCWVIEPSHLDLIFKTI